jgi:hypothetical protein
MIHKILQDGRMKIGLQDTIGAIHIAKRADMQDSVITADVVACARAAFKKGALMAG